MAFVYDTSQRPDLLARQSAQESRLYRDAIFRESESLYYVYTDSDHRYDAWMYEVLEFKKILAIQLPRMPGSYTVKLLTDKHHAVLMLKQRLPAAPASENNSSSPAYTYRTIGGVLFRSFPEIFAAELVFLAIHPDDQMKGYGQRLMATFKEVLKQQGLKFIVTYADNTAVDFFAKVGFSNKLTVPPNLWAKHIKDYEEATLMECVLLDIDYRGFHSDLGLLQTFTHQVVISGIGQQMRECEGLPAAAYMQPSSSDADVLTKLQVGVLSKTFKGIDLPKQLELLSKRGKILTRPVINRTLAQKLAQDDDIWRTDSVEHKSRQGNAEHIGLLNDLQKLLDDSLSKQDQVLEDKLLELTTSIKQSADFGSQVYKKVDRIEVVIEDFHTAQEHELQHPLLKKVG